MVERLDTPPPEAEDAPSTGRVVRVVEETAEPFRPLVVIDIDELRADFKDPDWQDFLHRAVAYRKELRDHGRLH